MFIFSLLETTSIRQICTSQVAKSLLSLALAIKNSPKFTVMAFVTYILLSTLLYGLAGHFNPEQLGYTASFAFTIVILEIVIIKIGCYLLSINNDSQLMDLVAYSGYKFVGIIVTLATTAIGSKMLEYLVFGYTFNANAFFLVHICFSLFLNFIANYAHSYEA